MTGNVPYYGGRLGPAQAYAASHSAPAVAPPPMPPPPTAPPMAATPAAAVPDAQAAQDAAAVQRLVASGVLTPQEAATIRARIGA